MSEYITKNELDAIIKEWISLSSEKDAVMVRFLGNMALLLHAKGILEDDEVHSLLDELSADIEKSRPKI
ncbi:MAG: hypothetical protein ACMVY4_02585 [Minwuia sp.]|uniref:hypothetical protein n=1 Tax=Minwuia sp. TaxID=2493630 RepID=UPI003A86A1B0